MFLLEILIALALLQLWSGYSPLRRDEWFGWWLNKLGAVGWLNDKPYLAAVVTLFVPIALLIFVYSVVPGAVGFLLSVVILVYCLGRGEFGAYVGPYHRACEQADWELAIEAAHKQGVDCADIAPENWARLNEAMLKAISYQGFERLFAVIFWFVLLGPLGALLYRLSFAYRRASSSEVALHWLWALEWAPARALSVSFAIAGNFVGCINRWRDKVFCANSSATKMLSHSALGALSADDEWLETWDVTQHDVVAVRRLYRRTLWMWLALLALWVLFGPPQLFG